MGERTVYVIHIAAFLAGLLLALSTLANGHLGHALGCAACLCVALVLRKVGQAKLDFDKHERGIAANLTTPKVNDFEERVHEMHLLFERLENAPMGPVERQRLRRRIVTLLREDERLARYYHHRLQERHPYLLNAF